MRRSLMVLGVVFLAQLTLSARAADPVGNWEGLLPVNEAMELRLVFHVEKGKEGGFKATFDSPDEAIFGLAAELENKPDGTFAMSIPIVRATYEAKLGDGAKEMAGTWSQAGKTFPVTMARMTRPEPKPAIWEGPLPVGAIKLRLRLRITQKADGTLRATLDSPDQSAKAIKIDKVEMDDKTLSVSAKTIQAEFSGKLNAEGTEAVGDWKQGGSSFPLTLKKTEKASEVVRPQTPKAPFPYRDELVTYPNKSAGITLAGTLTIPSGTGPFPSAILITGSGGQDRDETLLGHKPFLVLADYLSRRGVAVLRVDDRGVGKSTGSQSKATSEDFATDVEAGIAFLKAHKEIDPKQIGLIGHSEGGLIAPIVATKTPDVAYIVLLAGPGLPGDQILLEQSKLIGKAVGYSDAGLAKQMDVSRKIYEMIKVEKDEAKVGQALLAFGKELFEALPESERKALGKDPQKAMDAQLAILKSPWFRYFLTYDPRPGLAKVSCPVLAINGENDLQVPPKANLAAIAEALKSGGNTAVTTTELPGLNHLFQTSKTGSPSEYGAIEETFNPAALKIVGDWIVERFGPK